MQKVVAAGHCFTRKGASNDGCDNRYFDNNRNSVQTPGLRVDRPEEEKAMEKVGKCPICGGKTSLKRVDVTESVGKRLVLIRKVKAEVCS